MNKEKIQQLQHKLDNATIPEVKKAIKQKIKVLKDNKTITK